MKIFGVAALAMALLGIAAASPPPGSTSLVLVEWEDSKNVRSSDGCDGSDVICIDVQADVRFRVVRHFSGPRLRSAFRASIVYHSYPLRSTRTLLAVKQDKAGKLEAYRLDYVPAGEKLACFDETDVEAYGLVVPKGTTRVGDQYCVRPPRWVPLPI